MVVFINSIATEVLKLIVLNTIEILGVLMRIESRMGFIILINTITMIFFDITETLR